MRKNKGITKNRIVPFWILFAVLAASIIMGCATAPRYPAMPFAVHKAGTTIVQEVKLDYDVNYAFDLILHFERGDKEDYERVHKLAGSGSYHIDESGKIIPINDGVPIYLELKIIGLDEAVQSFYFKEKLFADRLIGVGHDPHDTDKYYFIKMIKGIRLKPGHYRIILKSLRDIPALEGTSVAFWLRWDYDAKPFNQ